MASRACRPLLLLIIIDINASKITASHRIRHRICVAIWITIGTANII